MGKCGFVYIHAYRVVYILLCTSVLYNFRIFVESQHIQVEMTISKRRIKNNDTPIVNLTHFTHIRIFAILSRSRSLSLSLSLLLFPLLEYSVFPPPTSPFWNGPKHTHFKVTNFGVTHFISKWQTLSHRDQIKG